MIIRPGWAPKLYAIPPWIAVGICNSTLHPRKVVTKVATQRPTLEYTATTISEYRQIHRAVAHGVFSIPPIFMINQWLPGRDECRNIVVYIRVLCTVGSPNLGKKRTKGVEIASQIVLFYRKLCTSYHGEWWRELYWGTGYWRRGLEKILAILDKYTWTGYWDTELQDTEKLDTGKVTSWSRWTR